MASLASFSLVRPLFRMHHGPQLLRRLPINAPGHSHIRCSSKKSAKAVKALQASKKATIPKTHPASGPPPKTTPAAKAQVVVKKPPQVQETIKGNYYSLASKLGERSEPTLLYSRPLLKHNLACYGIGSMAFYLVYNTWDMNLRNPSNVARSKVFQIISYVSMGLYTVVGVAAFGVSMRMIRSIRAVPYRPTPQSPPSVRILVIRNNILAIFPPIRSLVPLEDIYLQRSLRPKPTLSLKGLSNFQKAVQFIKMAPFRLFIAGKEFFSRDRCVVVFLRPQWFNLVLHEDGFQWEKDGLERLLGTKQKWQ
ncbi:hypothetical protein DFH27DRAFT_538098 [Peziza echinospora]|nr:hypothetical protein DFH27DRAFT_538098 [Peziza echinospora]